MADPVYEVSLLVPAMTFTGSEYVEKTTPTSLPVGSSTTSTMEAWARLNAPISSDYWISYYGVGGSGVAYVALFAYGLNSQVWGLSGAGGVIISGGNISSGEWTHLAGVLTGSLGNLYVDGTLVASAALFNTGSFDGMRTGARGLNASELWKGDLDEVRIWNTARTQQQISDNRYRKLTGNESG